MRTAPFGYKMIDGIFVVDELESQIVSWLFDKSIRYRDHPPAVLVEGVIEEYEITYDQDISYEEAEKMVSVDAIYDYMAREVRLRVEAFKLYSNDERPENLKHYLECPMAELNVDEVIEAYKKATKKLFREIRNPIITGKIGERRDRR